MGLYNIRYWRVRAYISLSEISTSFISLCSRPPTPHPTPPTLPATTESVAKQQESAEAPDRAQNLHFAKTGAERSASLHVSEREREKENINTNTRGGERQGGGGGGERENTNTNTGRGGGGGGRGSTLGVIC